MAATPKKLVHWALDMSASPFASSFSEASSSSAGDSTSSLQYINSQLIAHGFTHNPGLNLEGTSREDAAKVVKCLLAMLGQRVDDMSRTEELTTKLRTLSYDHERLSSMYRSATERAANAERETNLHKSRLAATTRTLQSTEAAHKHTTAELQRTRTALQAIRATHATELKKLDKEKERALDRWNKLADSQLKLGGSKFTCSNLEVVEASDVQLRGKGKGFLEVSAEQAEQARNELFNENRRLRGTILSAANEMQRLLHNARCLAASETREEPPLISTVTLFPISPPDAASGKVKSLLDGIKEAIGRLAQPDANPSCSTVGSSSQPALNTDKDKGRQELEILQGVIDTLRKELAEAQNQASTQAAQTQALFDRYASDALSSHLPPDTDDMSVDLITAPVNDLEQQRLDGRTQDLEDERRRFTEAAVKLGKEKAALEAERIKFLEEKRSWQVETMLAELPPTPAQQTLASTSHIHEPVAAMETAGSSRRSPRKVARKSKVVTATSSGKKARVGRRSSTGLMAGPASPKGKGKERAKVVKANAKAKSKVTPAFETEVLPSTSHAIPMFKTSLDPVPRPSQAPPTPAFILPPPSPASRLPSREELLSNALIPPLPPLSIPSTSTVPTESYDSHAHKSKLQPPAAPIFPPAGSYVTAPPPIAGPSTRPSVAGPSQGSAPVVPDTPTVRRPFPVAKPLAQHMIHAYSPVKPSPLSRILMLADSPESPPRMGLPPLSEEEENGPDYSPTPVRPIVRQPAPVPVPALKLAELGIPEEDDENPMFDRVCSREEGIYPRPKSALGHRGAHREQEKEKRRPPNRDVTSRKRSADTEKEKENNHRRVRTKTASGVDSSSGSKATDMVTVKRSTRSTTARSVPASTTTVTQPKIVPKRGASKAGPRRVPIDSAEAAPRTWKG
ncbi:hypothetical protein PHLCEN_2v10647 [Hermanssonia centrifuga]|uniref:Afadin and alpha-actinin-binding-domain-containing protein n=1 Tax=Hermanssonia centrifuga TaxID=98765 RepID=A0A2R6NMD4_9APHY|nr:hypothetical protein PHLCEN_2v10647 [Hermanssonia centrifuga]